MLPVLQLRVIYMKVFYRFRKALDAAPQASWLVESQVVKSASYVVLVDFAWNLNAVRLELGGDPVEREALEDVRSDFLTVAEVKERDLKLGLGLGLDFIRRDWKYHSRAEHYDVLRIDLAVVDMV